jgi:hypothetical protein
VRLLSSLKMLNAFNSLETGFLGETRFLIFLTAPGAEYAERIKRGFRGFI